MTISVKAVETWGMNMEYDARIWYMSGDFGLKWPGLWFYLGFGRRQQFFILAQSSMDGSEITCKISHNLWKNYGKILEDCGWFGCLQISHLFKKLTKTGRAAWFFQDLPAKQNIRTIWCVKIHEHLSDHFYSIWFKSCLTWHHLVVNFLVHIFWWGQNGIYFAGTFLAFRRFASAGPLGRVPKCLSAEKSIMENKLVFVSFITFDAEVGWEYKWDIYFVKFNSLQDWPGPIINRPR